MYSQSWIQIQKRNRRIRKAKEAGAVILVVVGVLAMVYAIWWWSSLPCLKWGMEIQCHHYGDTLTTCKEVEVCMERDFLNI